MTLLRIAGRVLTRVHRILMANLEAVKPRSYWLFLALCNGIIFYEQQFALLSGIHLLN